jgi:hypothetical protein
MKQSGMMHQCETFNLSRNIRCPGLIFRVFSSLYVYDIGENRTKEVTVASFQIFT